MTASLDQLTTDHNAQTIGFIGLGNIGAPMACNLQRAGYRIQAFDLSAPALQRACEAGLCTVATAAEAAQDADVLITMLPTSRHVESLYLGCDGQAGLLESVASNTLVIDSSTIAAATAVNIAAAACQQGIAMLDAPVSGGTAGAAKGTLTFMVGGDALVFERARPVLQAMGHTLFHAGAAGAGQAAKMCNNMLLGILMIGTSEALELGRANGLDPAVLSAIMRRSSGNNWALEVYNPMPGVMPTAPASRHYQGGFGTALMLKDLGLAMESAQLTQTITPLGTLARNLYGMHSLAGNGALDFSSIILQFGSKG